MVTVAAEDATDAPAAWAGAVFSDNARAPTSYTTSTRDWGRYSSTGNRNEVTLTLLDQYGDTYNGTSAIRYRFGLTPSGGTADDPAIATDDGTHGTQYGNVATNGRARIVYTSPATVRSETIGGTEQDSSLMLQSSVSGAAFTVVADTVTAEDDPTIYWAEPGSAAERDNAPVRVLDPAARRIVVDSDPEDPEYYAFGTDDTFIVGTTPVSFLQFIEVLNAANDSKIPEITLAETTRLDWSGYNVARPRDNAKWILTAICSSS